MSKYNCSPTLTVIIPCYNAENTILTTLESLENQTNKDFEVIVVNDGSIDNSDKIIKKKMNDNKLNLNYLYQDNSGVSVARNYGIKKSVGKYITFLDADDVYHKNFLEVLFKCVHFNKVDTAFCSYSRSVSNLLNTEIINMPEILELSHEELLNSFMMRKGPCSFFSFIYKKDIIVENNIYFNENLRYGEDIEFTWKYLINCHKGLFIDKALYGYYDNPLSAMNNISYRITDVLIAVKNIEIYMFEKKESFQHIFINYMFPRTLWSVQKDFALNGNKDYFKKVSEKYNEPVFTLKYFMNLKNFKIGISSIIYIFSKKSFYYAFKVISRMNGRKGV